jgi:hypothetical protein
MEWSRRWRPPPTRRPLAQRGAGTGDSVNPTGC